MSSYKNAIIDLMNHLTYYELNKALVCTKSKFIKLKGVLKFLIKYGVISSYMLNQNKLYLRLNPLRHFVVKYFSKTKYLSSYKIESLVNKFGGNVFLISTSLGIVDSNFAIEKRIGGRLLFVIKTKNSLIKTI